MIESFKITNHLGESLELTLADPDSSGLAITSVTGLGQVDADVNFTKLAGSDYYAENSAVLGQRNIVFNITYYGDDTEDCRHIADEYFPTKKKIDIIARTTHRELTTTGVVESNEPNIFSSKSGCTVSILCADPYWYALDISSIPFGGIEPKLEFPLCEDRDDSLTDNDDIDVFEFGNIRPVVERSIYYTGEAEVGITINIHVLSTVRNLIIYNVDLRQRISIDDSILTTVTGSGLIQGDDVIISTTKNQKYATLIRSGIEYNIINALGKQRDWFELSRGDNAFAYSATEGLYDMVITVKHRVSYKGL